MSWDIIMSVQVFHPEHLGQTKMKTIIRLIRNESGATAIEYGLLASLIAVAIIAGAATLGTSLNSTFQAISGAFPAS
jgi:pilus assembly protein Flp/PilA